MKKLIKILKSYKFPLSVCTIISVLSALLSIILILVTKTAVDYASAGNAEACVKEMAVFSVITMILILIKTGFRLITEKLKAEIEIELKNKVIGDYVRSEFFEIGKFTVGDILNRLNNDAKIVAKTAVQLPITIVGMITQFTATAFVLMSIMNNLVFILPTLCVVIVLISLIFRTKLKSLHRNQQEKESKTVNLFREILNNTPVIKAFDMYERLEVKENELQNDYYNARIKRRNFAAGYSAGMNIVFEIFSLAVIAICLINVLNGRATIGTLVALIQIISAIKTPAVNLTEILPAYYTMSASFERIEEIEQLRKDERTIISSNKIKSIVFDNVSFKYENEWVLQNFSCEIPINKITVIEGESGKGKSTLLKLLLGLYSPNEGTIYLKNTNDEKYIEVKEITEIFAYVPQGNQLFSMTIEDNLTLAAKDVLADEIISTLKISEIYENVENLPNNIKYKLGQEGKNLSEGQLQRIAIARAFISELPILLMDEPTSALDEMTEKKIINNIDKHRDKTYIIVSHKKAIEKICDKVIKI